MILKILSYLSVTSSPDIDGHISANIDGHIFTNIDGHISTNIPVPSDVY
jgi:hypothetical protein